MLFELGYKKEQEMDNDNKDKDEENDLLDLSTVDCEIIDLDDEDINSDEYTKLKDEERDKFFYLLQYVPKDAVQGIENKKIEGTTKKAYKLVLKDGLHLGKSHSVAGAYSGNAYDKDNHLKTAASWIPIDGDIKKIQKGVHITG